MDKPIAVLTDDIFYTINHFKLNNQVVDYNLSEHRMKDMYGRLYIIFVETDMERLLSYEIKEYIMCFSISKFDVSRRCAFLELVESRIR